MHPRVRHHQLRLVDARVAKEQQIKVESTWGVGEAAPAPMPRFEVRSGSRPYRLVDSPRFRMAYDFLAVRAASGEVAAELEAWWRTFHAADAETRKAMLLPDTGPRKRRRRRRRKKQPAAPATAPA